MRWSRPGRVRRPAAGSIARVGDFLTGIEPLRGTNEEEHADDLLTFLEEMGQAG